MKTITLLAAAALFMVSCSDDDGKKQTCDCQKVIAKYNENLNAYETIGSSYYSDDCSDRTDVFNSNGDGNYFRINCTPVE